MRFDSVLEYEHMHMHARDSCFADALAAANSLHGVPCSYCISSTVCHSECCGLEHSIAPTFACQGAEAPSGKLIMIASFTSLFASADAKADYYRSTAEGCLFQALAPLAAKEPNQSPLLQQLLQPSVLPTPSVPQSSQDIPAPDPLTAPVGQPTEKDRIMLQVCFTCIFFSGEVYVPPAPAAVYVFVCICVRARSCVCARTCVHSCSIVCKFTH